MASINLCNSKANLHKNFQQSLASVTLSSNNQTSTSVSYLSPHKHVSAKFPNLRIHSVGVRRMNNQTFNHVHKSDEATVSSQEPPLKIGIIGFGNFGQFISKAFVSQGHNVLATSRSDYSDYCQKNGIEFFPNVDRLCEEQPDVVLVCSSILSAESVIRGIPMHKLKKDTIFADVLSVKQFPRNLFLEALPQGFGIVCTHPMFGPESGKKGWDGLPFVFDQVRVTENSEQEQKCRNFLNVFEQEGCRMVEMSCEEHDRHAAGSQFVTHTIGRILSELDLDSTPINTKGYESLLQLTKNTVSDSFDLYYGLFMYNVNATEQIENLDRAFETVKQKLFGRLHDILRKQIVERVPVVNGVPQTRNGHGSPYFLPNTQEIKHISSFGMPPLPENTRGYKTRIHSCLLSSVNRNLDGR